MSEERSGDDITTTADALIKMTEEARVDGSLPLSPETRDILMDALTRDLNVASDEAKVTEDRFVKIEAQTRVLADAVIAIADTGPSVAVAPAVEAVKAERSVEVTRALPTAATKLLI